MQSLKFAIAAVFLAVAAEQAAANMIFNSVEIDLSLVSITADGSGGQLLFGFPATGVSVTPFTVQVGDVLQTTVTFKNGDRLRIFDGPNSVDTTPPDYFEALVFYFSAGSTPSGLNFTSTTAVSFSNLEGSLSDPTPGGSSSGGLGQALYPDFTNDQVSFDGLTLTSTVVSLSPTGLTYDTFGLWGGRAGGYKVISASVTPEPTSLALAGCAGLGMAVGAWRRRRQPKPQAA